MKQRQTRQEKINELEEKLNHIKRLFSAMGITDNFKDELKVCDTYLEAVKKGKRKEYNKIRETLKLLLEQRDIKEFNRNAN